MGACVSVPSSDAAVASLYTITELLVSGAGAVLLCPRQVGCHCSLIVAGAALTPQCCLTGDWDRRGCQGPDGRDRDPCRCAPGLCSHVASACDHCMISAGRRVITSPQKADSPSMQLEHRSVAAVAAALHHRLLVEAGFCMSACWLHCVYKTLRTA